MSELLTVGIFLPSIAAPIAVVVATCSGQRCVAVRVRALGMMAVNPAAHTPALLAGTHRIGKSFSIYKYTVLKGAIWAFRAAFSRGCVWVGAVEGGTSSPLTLYGATQAGTDVAGLLRGHKPLGVAIDAVVVCAAVARRTA